MVITIVSVGIILSERLLIASKYSIASAKSGCSICSTTAEVDDCVVSAFAGTATFGVITSISAVVNATGTKIELLGLLVLFDFLLICSDLL